VISLAVRVASISVDSMKRVFFGADISPEYGLPGEARDRLATHLNRLPLPHRRIRRAGSRRTRCGQEAAGIARDVGAWGQAPC